MMVDNQIFSELDLGRNNEEHTSSLIDNNSRTKTHVFTAALDSMSSETMSVNRSKRLSKDSKNTILTEDENVKIELKTMSPMNVRQICSDIITREKRTITYCSLSSTHSFLYGSFGSSKNTEHSFPSSRYFDLYMCYKFRAGGLKTANYKYKVKKGKDGRVLIFPLRWLGSIFPRKSVARIHLTENAHDCYFETKLIQMDEVMRRHPSTKRLKSEIMSNPAPSKTQEIIFIEHQCIKEKRSYSAPTILYTEFLPKVEMTYLSSIRLKTEEYDRQQSVEQHELVNNSFLQIQECSNQNLDSEKEMYDLFDKLLRLGNFRSRSSLLSCFETKSSEDVQLLSCGITNGSEIHSIWLNSDVEKLKFRTMLENNDLDSLRGSSGSSSCEILYKNRLQPRLSMDTYIKLREKTDITDKPELTTNITMLRNTVRKGSNTTQPDNNNNKQPSIKSLLKNVNTSNKEGYNSYTSQKNGQKNILRSGLSMSSFFKHPVFTNSRKIITKSLSALQINSTEVSKSVDLTINSKTNTSANNNQLWKSQSSLIASVYTKTDSYNLLEIDEYNSKCSIQKSHENMSSSTKMKSLKVSKQNSNSNNDFIANNKDIQLDGYNMQHQTLNSETKRPLQNNLHLESINKGDNILINESPRLDRYSSNHEKGEHICSETYRKLRDIDDELKLPTCIGHNSEFDSYVVMVENNYLKSDARKMSHISLPLNETIGKCVKCQPSSQRLKYHPRQLQEDGMCTIISNPTISALSSQEVGFRTNRRNINEEPTCTLIFGEKHLYTDSSEDYYSRIQLGVKKEDDLSLTTLLDPSKQSKKAKQSSSVLILSPIKSLRFRMHTPTITNGLWREPSNTTIIESKQQETLTPTQLISSPLNQKSKVSILKRMKKIFTSNNYTTDTLMQSASSKNKTAHLRKSLLGRLCYLFGYRKYESQPQFSNILIGHSNSLDLLRAQRRKLFMERNEFFEDSVLSYGVQNRTNKAITTENSTGVSESVSFALRKPLQFITVSDSILPVRKRKLGQSSITIKNTLNEKNNRVTKIITMPKKGILRRK